MRLIFFGDSNSSVFYRKQMGSSLCFQPDGDASTLWGVA